MPNTAKSILIEAPARDVFEFVADHRNITRFEKHFSRVTPLPGPTHGLGMVLDARGRFHGVPLRVKLRIEEFDKPKRIVSRSISGLKSLLEWEFTEENGGTRVKLFANYGWPFPFIPSHVKDTIRQEIDEMTAASLRELKRLIESSDRAEEAAGSAE